MGQMMLRRHYPFLKICDLCKKATHDLYTVELGGMKYNLCSGSHANQAQKNFEKNKDMNLQPAITLPEQFDDQEGDSLGLAG